MPYKDDFGARLVELRKACGFSQSTLAAVLTGLGRHTTQSTVTRWEHARAPVTVGDLPLIARALRVEAYELLPDAPPALSDAAERSRAALDAMTAVRLASARAEVLVAQERLEVARRAEQVALRDAKAGPSGPVGESA